MGNFKTGHFVKAITGWQLKLLNKKDLLKYNWISVSILKLNKTDYNAQILLALLNNYLTKTLL